MNKNSINEKLEKICEEMKNIPNIGLNYIEYISAFIYAIYQNIEKYEQMIKNKRPVLDILYEIEEELSQIRKKENSRKLFINIQFYETINQEYYEAIKKVLSEIIHIIKEETYSNLIEGFENILNKSAEKNELNLQDGEYYTPKVIIETMVNLLDIKDNMSIYNPATGTGDFISEVAKKAKIYAFGEETNIHNYNICMTNLWLHNVNNKRIQENIGENFRQADIAIGNPPFVGEDKKEVESNLALQELYYQYKIPITASNYTKFLVKMLGSLNEQGRMAIILPHGFLFKKTSAEYRVRKQIVEKNYIEAVIGLPEKIFYNTKIPVVILTINKAKKRQNVLFIDASREYKKQRGNNVLEKKAMNKIVENYQKSKNIQNYSYVANIKEIEKNDYDLNIKKYVNFYYEKEEVDQKKLQESILELEMERNKLQKEIEKILKD